VWHNFRIFSDFFLKRRLGKSSRFLCRQNFFTRTRWNSWISRQNVWYVPVSESDRKWPVFHFSDIHVRWSPHNNNVPLLEKEFSTKWRWKSAENFRNQIRATVLKSFRKTFLSQISDFFCPFPKAPAQSKSLDSVQEEILYKAALLDLSILQKQSLICTYSGIWPEMTNLTFYGYSRALVAT
jgi:hypothetical protein